MTSLVESPSELIENVQNALLQHEQADIQIEHVFTPGLYTRICRIPAGTLLVSAIHRSEHPFVVLEGKCRVFSENEGPVIYQAPYQGVTQPGTKRIIYTESAVTWLTFHATHLTDPLEIGKHIIEPESATEGHLPSWMQDALTYPNQHLTTTSSWHGSQSPPQ
jgi:hypothetical protein